MVRAFPLALLLNVAAAAWTLESLACSPGDFPSLAAAAPASREAASSPQVAALGGGSAWSTLTPLGTARQEVAVAELDGKIYVIGGINSTPAFLSSVEIYDPDTDSFSAGPALPFLLHHTTANAVGGKLYVIGGWSDFFATPRDIVLELDPQVGNWVARASMPTARGSPAAAVLDGKIYVAGGWPTSRSKDFAVYDPAADSWQTLSDLPSGRNHLAVAAADGRIFAVGGRTDLNAGVGNVATVDAFDPVAGTWSSVAALPRARGGLAAVGFDRFVFAFGGEGNAASTNGTFEDADVYDAASNAWSTLEPMPTPRHGIGAAIFNGRINIPGGGPVENFSVSDVHEALNVAAALGFPIPLLPAAGTLVLALGIAAVARWAAPRRVDSRS